MKAGSQITYRQSVDDPNWTDLASTEVKSGIKMPVVLYLHGCKGFGRQGERYRDLLVSEGYTVFMPDSFQRPGRRQCGQQGRLRERVRLRTEEVAYALERLQELAWVDRERLILMGFSEGGNTVDNWSGPGFAAHMIMGSACTLTGGSPAAPAGVAIPAIVGENDRYRPGKRCEVQSTVGGSRSIVLPDAGHSLAQYPETQAAIREFLRECCW